MLLTQLTRAHTHAARDTASSDECHRHPTKDPIKSISWLVAAYRTVPQCNGNPSSSVASGMVSNLFRTWPRVWVFEVPLPATRSARCPCQSQMASFGFEDKSSCPLEFSSESDSSHETWLPSHEDEILIEPTESISGTQMRATS